jgi:hypothetical protein
MDIYDGSKYETLSFIDKGIILKVNVPVAGGAGL